MLKSYCPDNSFKQCSQGQATAPRDHVDVRFHSLSGSAMPGDSKVLGRALGYAANTPKQSHTRNVLMIQFQSITALPIGGSLLLDVPAGFVVEARVGDMMAASICRKMTVAVGDQ